MKIIYFLDNGKAEAKDHAAIADLRAKGHKVTFSNGTSTEGFKDSCDAVILAGDFPHIEKWAVKSDIEIMVKVEQEPEKPKRGPKPKAKTEDKPSE